MAKVKTVEAAADSGRLTLDKIDYIRRERMALLKVNAQERKFCEEFVRTMDWHAAMKEAGYELDEGGHIGYDEKFNRKRFEGLIARPEIAEYIMLLKESVMSRVGFSLDQIIEEYRRIAFARIGDYYEWDKDGIREGKASKDLTDEQMSAIMEVGYVPGRYGNRISIKLFPKQSALDRLLEILRELEEVKKKEDSGQGLRISKTQINLFLQDPIARRAVEHIAEGLFDQQIFVTAKDKPKAQFAGHIDRMVDKYLNMEGGGYVGGGGSPRVAGALPGPESAGSVDGGIDSGSDGGFESSDEIADSDGLDEGSTRWPAGIEEEGASDNNEE